MDLKGLGGGTWKGFSDQELSKLKQASESSHDLATKNPPYPGPACKEPQNCQQSSSQGDTFCEGPKEISCDIEQSSCELIEAADQLKEQQRQQQKMEDENNRKKKILEEVLIQRYKESRTEAYKLENIQSELMRLDQLVTRDVAILRSKIEEATRDYSSARSRFEKAEKEYVSAKLSLATSCERKELLSQHLCAVIQENEGRKAAKLKQLMEELNIKEPSNNPLTEN